MTLPAATAILEEMSVPISGGNLFGTQNKDYYIYWEQGREAAYLHGEFTPAQILAIATWIEHHSK